MKLIDVVRRAGRSLRQAKVRTLLTSLAIGVGAFTITLSLAGGQGGRDYANAIVSANTDRREIAVSKPIQTNASNGVKEYDPSGSSAPAAQSFGDNLNEKDIEKLRTFNHVESVTPGYSPTVNYITTNGQKKYVVQSVSSYTDAVKLSFAAGDAKNIGDNGIILNEEYVKALGFGDAKSAIGKTVAIGATRQASLATGAPEEKEFSYVVKAVTSESGLAFRAQGSLLVSEPAVKTLYDFVSQGTPAYNQFFIASVMLTDQQYANEAKAEIEKAGYTAQTAEDLLGVVNTFINVLLGVLLGFGALAVLTSVFGIVNTQYISVLERTQQIGLMKALGMRRRDVGRLFIFEAGWIGFIGGAIGAGLAILAGTIANPIISKQLDLNGIHLLIFDPFQVAGVIVMLVIIAILAGVFPSRKASKLDPIEALRTE